MKKIIPNWVNEGVGAKVIRVIGTQKLQDVNPFLMLDYFHVKLPAGFPDHPHRGFQTITYMLQGSFYHEDFKGHKGKIGPGDVQWMTAGKGIIHSQIPASETQLSKGFQLWLNLQAKYKMIEPQYQEYQAKDFPIVKKQNSSIKIIAGEVDGKRSPINLKTSVLYLDVIMDQGKQEIFNINKKWSTLIFVYKGEIKVNKQMIKQNSAGAYLQQTPSLEVCALSDCKFLIISGQKINQHVQKYGPFVMNTQKEIKQTFKDYQEGKNGFENNKWQSKIKDLMQNSKLKF